MAAIIPASEIPSVSLLYKLGRLDSSTPTAFTVDQSLNDKTCLIQKDITKLQVDVIVNAASSRLLGGGGVDGAIHRAAGPRLYDECKTLGGCATGDAKMTHGYNLPSKRVIHTVGPVYTYEKDPNMARFLASCYRKSLELCVERNMRTIAFSAVSTGGHGYPSLPAAETAIRVVREFLQSAKGKELDKVIFCNFQQKDENAYKSLIPVFFPPTEKDLSREQQAQAEENALAAQLPNVPTNEPLQSGEPGAMKAKKHSEDLELDWETVVSTGESAENGPVDG
ncbi:MAG: hypothetical protein M1829_000440 [Trizodia sp. TS-e1964]|nr:MAG: hypothetical protein M1829_000440 [Trizodia sp. TS-e1964]